MPRKHRRKPAKTIPAEPSGEPREMNRIGEALSGEQPEIGDKDIGERGGVPPRRPERTRRRR